MGNALTWTPAERWQALQQLQSALGQPDTNMFFTYNGVVYRSVSINSNGTMQVINQATGQVSTLDPVDVYSAFQAASGNPIPTQVLLSKAAPVSPTLVGVQNIMGQIGFYSGLIPVIKFLSEKLAQSGLTSNPIISKFFDKLNSILDSQVFGMVAGSVGAALGAYSVFTGLQDMFKNGFSKGGMLNVLGSAFGVASGVNMAMGNGIFAAAGWEVAGIVVSGAIEYGAINDMIANGVSAKSVALAGGGFFGMAVLINLVLHGVLFSNPIGWIIAGAWTAFSILWSLFHQPPPEQIAAQNLQNALTPVIWTPGPLLVVAVGTIALLMGWAKNRPAPIMATLTVPAYHLNQVLAASGVPPVDLKSKVPSVIVEPGTGNVIIVSPGNSGMVTLKSYQLAKNLQFVSSPNVPPEGAYIPFFLSINGKVNTRPNPDIIQALSIQEKMLTAVLSGTMLTHDALNALFVAAASNKYGVGVGG